MMNLPWKQWRIQLKQHSKAAWAATAATWGAAAVLVWLGEQFLPDTAVLQRILLQFLLILPLSVAGVILVPWAATQRCEPEEAFWTVIRTAPSMILLVIVMSSVLMGAGQWLLTVLATNWIPGVVMRFDAPVGLIGFGTTVSGLLIFGAWSRWVALPVLMTGVFMGRDQMSFLDAIRSTRRISSARVARLLLGAFAPLVVFIWTGDWLWGQLGEILPGASAGTAELVLQFLWRTGLSVGLGPWLGVMLAWLATPSDRSA